MQSVWRGDDHAGAGAIPHQLGERHHDADGDRLRNADPGVSLRRYRAGDPGARPTQLKVVTTKMRPGYLRKNGIPYSANATLEEWYDRFTEPNGDDWLV